MGYGDGGELTEPVRRRPYSVVLFDEIEKAHPDVMHTLLQILEEGRITDSLGRRVDFRNTIIIMTSNVGAAAMGRNAGALGFSGSTTAARRDADKLQEEAKKVFKPEFLNRVDDIVVFRKLEQQDLIAIVEIELAKLQKRLEARSLSLEMDKAAKEFIISKGNAAEYGARPLRRAVERYLEDPLSEALLRGDFEKAAGVRVTAGAEELQLTPVTAVKKSSKARAKTKSGKAADGAKKKK